MLQHIVVSIALMLKGLLNSVEEGIMPLVTVHADISRVPQTLIPKRQGADGKLYWVIEFEIETTYLSAFTKYELIYDGVNYGPVHAEYV